MLLYKTVELAHEACLHRGNLLLTLPSQWLEFRNLLIAREGSLHPTNTTLPKAVICCEASGEALERLERDRDALMESYSGMVSETLEDLAPKERHGIYKLLRLGVRFRPDWPLEITGIFAQVGEEAETSSSDRKLRPLSV